MPLVETVDCDTANDFLDCLTPRGRFFCGQESVGSMRSGTDAWLYRGHPDDSYVLIPSALRGPASFAALGWDICETNRSQVRSEADTLQRFFDLSDATGLPLPEDSQALRILIREIQSEDYYSKLDAGTEIWPPRPLWSLIGIAQHYGAPTRLLDWSHKALTAAYFAAQGALARLSAAAARTREVFGVPRPEALQSVAWKLKLDEPSAAADPHRAEKARAWAEYRALERRKLTVWAFAYGKYASRFGGWYATSRSTPTPDLPIAKVTAPHAQNANLHAQDGLFTLHLAPLTGKLDQPVDRLALDTVAGKSLVDLDPKFADHQYFYRVRLPWSHAEHLMWLLTVEGVSAATIYPGYKGVVLALQDERTRKG